MEANSDPDLVYWGAFTPDHLSMSFAQRRDVMTTAVSLMGYDIGYPIFPNVDLLRHSSNPGPTIEYGELTHLRCDGLVEYAYEVNGIHVWGANAVSGLYDVSQTANVDSHNDFYDAPWDPNTEAAPIVQCGLDGEGGISSHMIRASQVDLPLCTASSSLFEDQIWVTLSAEDTSGIHRIAARTGDDPWTYSPTQNQHPDSASYAWQFTDSPASLPATVHYQAHDNAGNVSPVLSIPVTDGENPTVSITSPTSEATYTTSQPAIDIGGTAFDWWGLDQVTWSNDRGGGGTCSGTESWSQNSITLYEGQNILTVRATDAAGNSSTDTLTVTQTCAVTDAPSWYDLDDCGRTGIHLSWNSVGADSYDIFRDGIHQIGTTTNTSWDYLATPDSGWHSYRIRANHAGCSALSPPTDAKDSEVPPPPCAAALFPANGQERVGLEIDLVWNFVPGAIGYDLYFGTGPTPPLVASDLTGTSYSVTGLSIDTVHYWKIVPRNLCYPANTCPTWWFRTTPCVITCQAVVPVEGTAGFPHRFSVTYVPTDCEGPAVFSWDFGDGTTSNEQNPIHEYAAAGNYHWTVTVERDGAACVREGDITVTEFDHTIVDDFGRGNLCFNSVNGDWRIETLGGRGAAVFTGRGVITTQAGVMTIASQAGVPWQLQVNVYPENGLAHGSFVYRAYRCSCSILDSSYQDNQTLCGNP